LPPLREAAKGRVFLTPSCKDAPQVGIKDGKEFVTVVSGPHLLRRTRMYRSREQIHASRKRAISSHLLYIAPTRRRAPARGIHKSHTACMSRLSRTVSSSRLRSLVRRRSFFPVDSYSGHRYKFLIMVMISSPPPRGCGLCPRVLSRPRIATSIRM
jgi:hypothetical protein